MTKDWYKTKVETNVFLDEDFHVVAYRGTPVVRFNDEKIILNTGGWMTATTKSRMNEASRQYGLGYSVSQINYEWFVTYKGRTIPFMTDELILRR